ncbi:MAG TPA: tetratricopeptide repeat protein [Sphingomicrobium sp.]
MTTARRLLCLAALALVTAACADQVKPVPETKDRLPDAKMERLAAQPMAVVRSEGVAAGKAAFERLLADTRMRKGPRSVEAADLLTAFAVELYLENPEPGSAEYEAAREYLKDAVPAYVAAFGPNHPEVALALNTRADIERKQSPDDPSPLVDSLLQQALRIRMKSLGPSNAETAANLAQLASISALPKRLERDPNGLATADSYYRRAITAAVPGPEGDERSNKAALELRLAELHARSGNPRVALAEARKALAISGNWTPTYRRCQLVESELGDFVELMAARGMGAEAEAIVPKGRDSGCSGPTLGEELRGSLRRLFGFEPS